MAQRKKRSIRFEADCPPEEIKKMKVEEELIEIELEPLCILEYDQDETYPTDEELLQCQKCGISYKSKASLKNHIQVCKSVVAYPEYNGSRNPNEESRSVSIVSTFQNGIRKVDLGERNSIKILERSCFGNVEDDYQEDGAQFDCLECDESFSNSKLYARHLYAHTFVRRSEEELPCMCSHCGREFPNKHHIDLHFLTSKCVGEPKIYFPCKVCQKIFNRKDNLREHLANHLGIIKNKKQYICKFCLKSFGGASLLTIHLKVHSGKKPFTCLECVDNFADPKSFKAHIQSHSKKFDTQTITNENSNGKRGQKKTTNPAPKISVIIQYFCSQCNHKFSTRSELSVHERSHNLKPKKGGTAKSKKRKSKTSAKIVNQKTFSRKRTIKREPDVDTVIKQEPIF